VLVASECHSNCLLGRANHLQLGGLKRVQFPATRRLYPLWLVVSWYPSSFFVSSVCSLSVLLVALTGNRRRISPCTCASRSCPVTKNSTGPPRAWTRSSPVWPRPLRQLQTPACRTPKADSPDLTSRLSVKAQLWNLLRFPSDNLVLH
jgi:hypothetical protein